MTKDMRTEETFNLIDFAAVIIRFRNLIIAALLFAVVFALVLFTILPLMNINLVRTQQDISIAETDFLLPWFSTALSEGNLGIDDAAIVQTLYNNEAVLGAIYREASDYDEVNIDILSALENVILPNLNVTYIELERRVHIQFTSLDPVFAERFVYLLTSNIGQRLVNSYMSVISEGVDMYDTNMNLLSEHIIEQVQQNGGSQTFSDSAISAIEPALIQAFQWQTLVAELRNRVNGDRVQSNLAPSIMMRESMSGLPVAFLFVVTVLGFLFVAICIAFFLDYLRRVKADEESMRKLKSAWSREKRV